MMDPNVRSPAIEPRADGQLPADNGAPGAAALAKPQPSVPTSNCPVAIVGLVEHCRPDIRVCLVNVADADVAENIAAAAERMAAPVTIWTKGSAGILGPAPHTALGDALAFSLARPAGVRACDYAPAAGISITNASSRFLTAFQSTIASPACTLTTSGRVTGRT